MRYVLNQTLIYVNVSCFFKNLDAAQAVLGGNFIASNAYIREEELSVSGQLNG